MNKKRSKEVNLNTQGKIGKIFSYIGMVIVCFISLFPLMWTFLSSLKVDPLKEPGLSFPKQISFDGYITVFRDMGIMGYFLNSFCVAAISVAISITIITMSAYVVARMDFKFKKVISVCLMSTLFIPATSLTFPVYNLVTKLGLYNKRGGLILIYTCMGIAISFMVIKNYFLTIPKELEEAACIDGCSYTQTFFKIMLPIARPGIMTAAVLAFMNYWNEYYWSSMVLLDREKMTVPALLSQFTTSFSTNYNGLFSAIVVIVIPPIILFCCCSKFFVEALSGGAVKG